MLHIRFPRALQNVEDLLHACGIDASHETVLFRWNRLRATFAAEICRKHAERMRSGTHCQWQLDEVFMNINGEKHFLWRAVESPISLRRKPWLGVNLEDFLSRHLRSGPRFVRFRRMSPCREAREERDRRAGHPPFRPLRTRAGLFRTPHLGLSR